MSSVKGDHVVALGASFEYQSLSSYRRCADRIAAKWSDFLASRQERLRQQLRHGIAAEKVAETILEDLFTRVLDWEKGDIDYQVRHADIVLTRNFIKYLVVEAKYPGALTWWRSAVDAALDQAGRYAAEQKITRLAISDGQMLYAADFENGGLRDRLFVRLDRREPPQSLWWISLHGIYRPREGNDDRSLVDLLTENQAPEAAPVPTPGELLHPKYHLPARCFAYVGNAADPRTWSLPHLDAGGAIDEKRLPKAIQSVISNYRGAKVSKIPEPAIPNVLVRLAHAAKRAGKLPTDGVTAAPVYHQLVAVLNQLGRFAEVQAS